MTDQRGSASGPVARPPADDQGGDPVCWLNRVCPECGRFAADSEDGRPVTRCLECGAELPG
jgi:ribosomal protein S27AE